jgi:hypothetical protein
LAAATAMTKANPRRLEVQSIQVRAFISSLILVPIRLSERGEKVPFNNTQIFGELGEEGFADLI